MLFLHEYRIIHRDIKPANLAIATVHPPRGVILDLGLATIEQRPTNPRPGTRPYQAPELHYALDRIERDKSRAILEPYTNAVDVFGLGLSMTEFLCNMRVEKHGVTGLSRPEYYMDFDATISDWMGISVLRPAFEFVKAMVRRDPKTRLSSEVAARCAIDFDEEFNGPFRPQPQAMYEDYTDSKGKGKRIVDTYDEYEISAQRSMPPSYG